MDRVRNDTRYGVLVVAVALLGIGGYGAYLLYPRFNLPAVDAAGLAVLSLAAGVAAFFSPCSFPLLATLLIRETHGGEERIPGRRIVLSRALTYAAALSLGTVVFLALTASVIAAGGQALVEQVTFTSLAGRVIRTLVGALLIVLGLVQVGVLRLSFYRVADLARPLLQSQAGMRRRAPVAAFTLFGFGYLVAGFG
ncbi:MAG TPA: cytochrome c biogenesis protein CcdA [bacterium]|nr:cytochrome c biogenesis protein CcdA [bacterium]